MPFLLKELLHDGSTVITNESYAMIGTGGQLHNTTEFWKVPAHTAEYLTHTS